MRHEQSGGNSKRIIYFVLTALLAIVLIVALSRGLAGAQGLRDPQKGKDVATKLCVSCHAVGDEGANRSMRADIPSFLSIANQKGQSAERIAGRIVVPHPPMPQVALTREEVADIAVYIMTLRHGEGNGK